MPSRGCFALEIRCQYTRSTWQGTCFQGHTPRLKEFTTSLRMLVNCFFTPIPRKVCRRFNNVNQMLLNKGFRQLEKYQTKCLREVKSQLPRRESERRNHPLFRHCDILTAIETRVSLLNMTFMKYVDSNMCCFIPGKVIDEIYRVLRFIQCHKTRTLPRSHEILTELRDISSMAMEHFEEKIIGSLKSAAHTTTSPRFSVSSSFVSHSALAATTSSSLALNKAHSLQASSEDFSDLASSNIYYRSFTGALKKEVNDMKSKINEVRRKLNEQEKVTLEQNRIISEQATKLTSQEGKLSELSRKMLEYDTRLNEVLRAGGHTRDKQSGSSSSTSNSWARDDPASSQYFVPHGLQTSAISPAVFVPDNIIQPNLVTLAATSVPVRTYPSSSALTRHSSGRPITSSGRESPSKLSQTVLIKPPARYNAGQGSRAGYSTSPAADNKSQPGPVSSSEEDSCDRQSKRRRKRRCLNEDGSKDSHSRQRKL
ncbi:F-box only protein 28 [Chionoecetes opilio]|uniref:F-box only protein 28 n=1 Tax=Chionoecetes opilio TaxID=41210 RepID=A0A8J4XN59_CHIOP|nr:F-box only protein 28 [Chionoecetes opilio]